MTLQNCCFSAAFGLEAGLNVIGPLLGGEWRPFASNVLVFTAYAHYAQPLRGKQEHPNGTTVDASIETGVSVRTGSWFGQYAYTEQASGRSRLGGAPEGVSLARAWHLVVLGRHY